MTDIDPAAFREFCTAWGVAFDSLNPTRKLELVHQYKAGPRRSEDDIVRGELAQKYGSVEQAVTAGTAIERLQASRLLGTGKPKPPAEVKLPDNPAIAALKGEQKLAHFQALQQYSAAGETITRLCKVKANTPGLIVHNAEQTARLRRDRATIRERFAALNLKPEEGVDD